MTPAKETPKYGARRLSSSAIADGYEPQALHEYTDKDGKPLHWHIRMKHPITGKKWIRPMMQKGHEHVLVEPKYQDGKPLYRLHVLAARPSEPVIVAEGEWCADALEKARVLATTSGSADSAKKADWTPLEGRDVIIWPDNDDAGQHYKNAVVDALLPLARRVQVIDVAALNLPDKGDAVDWLTANPNAMAEDIHELPKKPVLVAGEMGWPEPQQLIAKVQSEPYPVDALPKIIRKAVEEVASFVQSPVSLIASSALSAISLAVQAYIDVERAGKLTGPVSLYFLSIADSGERKSTGDRYFSTALREYQESEAERAKPLISDYRANLEAWEAKRSGVKEKIRQLAKNGKPTGMLEKELRNLEHEKPLPPKVPRLIYVDATPEALAFALAKYYPSAGVLSPEGGVVLGAHGMGKESLMRNLSLLNVLWDGDTLTIDRKSTESFTVKDARLTVGLQVQEATFRDFLERTGALARGSGFLSRFLLAWPQSTQGNRPFTEASSWDCLSAFNRRMADILRQPVPIDENGSLSPTMLRFTPEAKQEWIEFHDAIERELAIGGELYDVRDVASKIADNAARLAALFQVFEQGIGPISRECFTAASRIVAWHLNESRRFFSELTLSVELVNAARLDSWLVEYCQQHQTNLVPTRTVQQYGPHGLRDKAALEVAMHELTEQYRARMKQDGKRRLIEMNPALLVFATATFATSAKHENVKAGNVATVAGVAVALSPEGVLT